MTNVTFTVPAGKSFKAGQWALAQSKSVPTAQIYGQIVSYAGTTLVMTPVATGGSGTHSDWTIVLSNSPAAEGYQPPLGIGNVIGPGSAVAGNLPKFADTTGKVLLDTGIQAGALAGRNQLVFGDAGTKSIGAAALADGAAPLPFVGAQPADNLVLSNDGTNPNTDIQISVGRARDQADTTNLQLAGAMLKRINLPWAAGGAVGSPAGVLLSGSSFLASKTYHFWLIGNLGQAATQCSRTSNVATVTVANHGLGVGGTARVTGVGGGFDAVAAITATTTNTISYANGGSNVGATACAGTVDGFDVGATQQDAQGYPSATLPSGWTVKQCIGSVMTSGAAVIYGFMQLGDLFDWTNSKQDVNTSGTQDGAVSLTVPSGLSVLARLGLQITESSGLKAPRARVTALDSTDETVSVTNADVQCSQPQDNAGNSALTSGAAQCLVRTNGSAQVRINVANADGSTTFNANTYGWRDPRRRLF